MVPCVLLERCYGCDVVIREPSQVSITVGSLCPAVVTVVLVDGDFLVLLDTQLSLGCGLQIKEISESIRICVRNVSHKSKIW